MFHDLLVDGKRIVQSDTLATRNIGDGKVLREAAHTEAEKKVCLSAAVGSQDQLEMGGFSTQVLEVPLGDPIDPRVDPNGVAWKNLRSACQFRRRFAFGSECRPELDRFVLVHILLLMSCWRIFRLRPSRQLL